MNINVEKLYLHLDVHENFALVSIVFFFSRGKIKYLISKEHSEEDKHRNPEWTN